MCPATTSHVKSQEIPLDRVDRLRDCVRTSLGSWRKSEKNNKHRRCDVCNEGQTCLCSWHDSASHVYLVQIIFKMKKRNGDIVLKSLHWVIPPNALAVDPDVSPQSAQACLSGPGQPDMSHSCQLMAPLWNSSYGGAALHGHRSSGTTLFFFMSIAARKTPERYGASHRGNKLGHCPLLYRRSWSE